MARSLLGASALVSLALLFSRLSGLIREQVLGAQLGLGANTDGVLLLLTLPDLLIGILLSGGFGAALIPALSKVGPADRIVLLRRVGIWTLGAGMALAGLVVLAMPVVVGLLAPSLDTSVLTGFRAGFVLVALTVPVAALIGLASAYLNVKGLYALPAYAVLVFNGVLVVYFAVGLTPSATDFAKVGAVVLAAACLRLAVQGIRMPEVLGPVESSARFSEGFAARFSQGVIAYSLVVSVPIIFRSLFALEGPGALAQFNYALRVFELYMGILIAPLIIVFLPLLSSLTGAQDPYFQDRTRLAAEVAFLLSTVAALMSAVFALPLATLLFGYGALEGAGAASIAETLAILMLGMPFMALFQVMGAALNATERTRLVMVYSVVALAGALAATALLVLVQVPVGQSAKLGLSIFSLLACLLSMRAVLGTRAASRLLLRFGARAVVLGILVAAPASIQPWLRDGIVTPGDVGMILTLALILLLLNHRVFLALAAVRDQVARRTGTNGQD